MESNIVVNMVTEVWVTRKFSGGPLDGTEMYMPKLKKKSTHYVYGNDLVNGHKVDVMEYVYRLDGEVFVNTEVNGILKEFK